MRSTLWLLLLLAATLTAVVGCSDDATAPNTTQSSTGLLEGQIGDADFEISVNSTANAHRRWEGPFVLRGFNLHYVDSLAALVVDLTITNRGKSTYSEPIGLTFVKLIPDGVTVLNPDNGINGPGAAITFAFANDDGLWTPGEASLPRTVQFGVDKGVSIGFVARLNIGEPTEEEGGVISGRVWNDANEDGVMDPDEPGIPGTLVFLRYAGDGNLATHDGRRETRTGPEGFYAFRRLPAGMYVVAKPPTPLLKPTTPSEITVLLTEVDGDVSDFTDANFGCVVSFDPPPIPVGVFVKAGGTYLTEPDRLAARRIELRRCQDNDDGLLGAGDGDDYAEDCTKGKLRGPVTGTDSRNYTFAIMGTWVVTDAENFPPNIEVGQRLDVSVHRADDGGLVVDLIEEWGGDHEEVHGRVQRAAIEDNVILLRVLDTLVIVTRDASLIGL